MIETTIIIAAICYMAHYSIQPGMIFQDWLLYWAKRTLDKNKVNYSEFDNEMILDMAVSQNKWLKPLGSCIKCFAPWFLLPFAIVLHLSGYEDVLFIYLSSTILAIWLAAQT